MPYTKSSLRKNVIVASALVAVISYGATSTAVANPTVTPYDSGVGFPQTESLYLPVANTQTLVVSSDVQSPDVSRDGFSATDPQVLAAIKAEEERVAAEKAAAEAAALKAAEDAKAAAEAAAKLKSNSKSGGSSSVAPAPSFTPNPGSAQAYAQTAVAARGWSTADYNCLVSLWNKESGWRANANNPSSGAYGIPQALPGSKMASAGADWQTNANTQIEWGLGYISGRYGTPCGAWGHSVANNWY